MNFLKFLLVILAGYGGNSAITDVKNLASQEAQAEKGKLDLEYLRDLNDLLAFRPVVSGSTRPVPVRWELLPYDFRLNQLERMKAVENALLFGII